MNLQDVIEAIKFSVKDQEVQLSVDQHMAMTNSFKDDKSTLTTFNILVNRLKSVKFCFQLCPWSI